MDSPIYTAALADRAKTAVPWIDTRDCAKLIRSALARNFPGVKFSVRIDRYAGGSSVSIAYDGVVKGANGWPVRVLVDYDGNVLDPTPVTDPDYTGSGRYGYLPLPGMPKSRDVDVVVSAYGSARFDGMIDLAYSVSSWLMPDGSAALAASPGTDGSRGMDPSFVSDAPSGDAIHVHFGAGYIRVHDAPYHGPVHPDVAARDWAAAAALAMAAVASAV